MILELFCLCDAATADNGKLNILGVFDAIRVKQFPAVLAHCAVAVRLRFFSLEQGEHHIEVRFIDADGKNVLPPAGGSIQVSLQDGQRTAAFNLVLNIPALKVETPGEYAMDLRVGGQGITSLPIVIKQV